MLRIDLFCCYEQTNNNELVHTTTNELDKCDPYLDSDLATFL